MIILGVDPGFQVTGYAIIKREQRTISLLASGALKMSPSKSLSERVAIFHDFFYENILKYGVTVIALETSFLGKNAQNFLKLGYLRGILYLLAHKQNAHLHEFAPREIKQSVTGFGGAGKDQVARVIIQLFPRLITPETFDVTDAIAVALCALWRQQQTIAQQQLTQLQ